MLRSQASFISRPFVRNSSSLRKLTRVPSKYNSVHSAGNVKPNYEPGLYHHPAPSIGIETPEVFLPSNDARKGLNLSGRPQVNIENAPALTTPSQQDYKLTPKDVEDIQKLRLEEPEKWTRKALAERFGVSPFTISLVSNPNEQRNEEMQGRLQTIKESWKRERYLARLDRKKRQVSWYRDE